MELRKNDVSRTEYQQFQDFWSNNRHKGVQIWLEWTERVVAEAYFTYRNSFGTVHRNYEPDLQSIIELTKVHFLKTGARVRSRKEIWTMTKRLLGSMKAKLKPRSQIFATDTESDHPLRTGESLALLNLDISLVILLYSSEFNSIPKVARATDEQLLTLLSIDPAKLDQIRKFIPYEPQTLFPAEVFYIQERKPSDAQLDWPFSIT